MLFLWATAPLPFVGVLSDLNGHTDFGQSFFKRLPPSGRERLEVQRIPGPIKVFRLEVKQLVYLPNRQAFRVTSDAFKDIARTNIALLQNTKVKAHLAAGQKQLREGSKAHLDPELVTRGPWLGHLDLHTTHAKDIPNARVVLQHPFDGEIFPELPMAEIGSSEFAFLVIEILD